MVFQHIEKLKREFTDKYVVVDAERPELRRFQSQTGLVRTVNMNGRALVEFDGALNIGWYDIDLDFLRVVDKPAPKEAEAKKAAPKKAAPKPKADAGKAEKKKPAAGGGMSVADILAAARGGDAGEAKAEAPAPKAEKKPAAAAGGAGMSVADILAAARGEGSGESKPAEAAAAEPEAVEAEPEEKIVVEEAAAEPEAAPAGDIPTDVPGILAYCRKVDDK